MKDDLLYPEFCDPFDGKQENFWMKIEHFGRYLYSVDEIKKDNRKIVVGDFGCANGYGTKEISKYADEVYGFDKNYIDDAKEKNSNTNIKYNYVDLDNLNINKLNKFDYITCFEVLEHLDKPYKFLKQAYDLLKPNGKMFISIPNSKYESVDKNGTSKNIYHKHIFDINTLLDNIKEIGYEVEITLGQSITNIILNKEYHLIKNGVIDYNEAITKYNYDEETIRYFSKIIGYPNKLYIKKSYSYFIVIQKR